MSDKNQDFLKNYTKWKDASVEEILDKVYRLTMAKIEKMTPEERIEYLKIDYTKYYGPEFEEEIKKLESPDYKVPEYKKNSSKK